MRTQERFAVFVGDGGPGKAPLTLAKLCIARPICLRLFTHWARRAASRAACTAGSKGAITTPVVPGELMLGIDSRSDEASSLTIDEERGRCGKEQGPQLRGTGNFGRVEMQCTSRTGTPCLARRRQEVVQLLDESRQRFDQAGQRVARVADIQEHQVLWKAPRHGNIRAGNLPSLRRARG